MRVWSLSLVLAVCAAGLFAMPQPIERAKQQDTVAQIDFDALHAQAHGALEKLRQSQARGLALTTRTAL